MRLSGPTVAVVPLLLSVAAGAGEAPPSFRSQAEIVTVDVVVLGPDGKPAFGLTRDDFVVKEDGRPQTISAFEAVEARVPALEAPETLVSAPSRVATNVAGPPTRRAFAIVFDDVHVGDLDMARAKRAVDAFVRQQARPGDRLVLFTTSDARFWATTRAAGDEAFVDALHRVKSHERKADPFRVFPMTHFEAMRIEEANDEHVLRLLQTRGYCKTPIAAAGNAGPRGPAGGTTVPSASQDEPRIRHCFDAAEIYALERSRLAGTLRVLREVIRKIGQVAGRRSLVLVTTGFPVDPSLSVLREVRDEAARANVTVSYLDPRGVDTGPPIYSAQGREGIAGPDIGMTVTLWRQNEEGPKALAEETGGLVLQTNDLVAGLQKVADESRVTYLLGYAPTNDRRDGRYRKLKVEVRRPGLHVRARAGYFAAERKEKPAAKPDPVDRALRDVFDVDAIPLRLAAYVMGPAAVESPVPKTGAEVLIAGELRLDALESVSKDGRRVAEPTLKLLTSSREGESHESKWTLEVGLSDAVTRVAANGGATEAVAAKGLWHPFLTRIAMGPGDHRARLVVQSGDRIGSVTVDFVVPPVSDERLSTPILSDRLVANASERRLLPLARSAFDATSALHCWIELHGAAKDEATGQPRATAAFVVRSSDGREWASGAPTAMSLEAGRPTRLVSLPLTQAPVGDNELVLTVRDEVSGRRFEAVAHFRVEPAAPSAPSADVDPGREGSYANH